jgi:hypothetical protein
MDAPAGGPATLFDGRKRGIFVLVADAIAKNNSAMNTRSPMAHIGEGSMIEYAELLERLRAMIGDDSSEANIYKQASDAIKRLSALSGGRRTHDRSAAAGRTDGS